MDRFGWDSPGDWFIWGVKSLIGPASNIYRSTLLGYRYVWPLEVVGLVFHCAHSWRKGAVVGRSNPEETRP